MKLRGIRKRFGVTLAVDDVDLDIVPGRIHALIGENGAGKSTLLKIVSGALLPDAGHMELRGKAYAPKSPADARQLGIGMIYQELSLAQHLSVEDNLVLGCESTRGPFLDRRTCKRRAREALAAVGRAELPLGTRTGTLARSEQQLIEIARAVALGCDVLLLDEPTSSLAQRGVEHLFTLMRRLRDEGKAIVYISHALDRVFEIGESYSVLRDGRLVASGDLKDTTQEALIQEMVAREVDELSPRGEHPRFEAILEVEGLRGKTLPLDASLTLHRGEVLGIAGLVGAGRTEFFRAIFGLDPVREGKVRVKYQGSMQESTHDAAPHRRWRQGVGMLDEDRKRVGLMQDASISENLTLARLGGLGPLGLVMPKRQRAVSEDWIRKLGVKCRSSAQRLTHLSGGNQQKIALARLLHADCDVLLLDEPTCGIDVGSKAEVYSLIDKLARGNPDSGREPKAVLLSSSYLPELLGVCDRIAVMCQGRLGAAHEVKGLESEDLMREAIGGGK